MEHFPFFGRSTLFGIFKYVLHMVKNTVICDIWQAGRQTDRRNIIEKNLYYQQICHNIMSWVDTLQFTYFCLNTCFRSGP